MKTPSGTVPLTVAALLAVAAPAGGQTTPGAPVAPATPATPATPGPAEAAVHTGTRASVTLGGYIEAFYAYNFNRPWNDITNYRGFDNRHNTFTIQNAALDFGWSLGPVTGRLIAQVGHTPQSYYGAEPSMAGTSGAGPSDFNVWKFLQQAYVGWRAPAGRDGLLIEAGLFVSPIGPEGFAVKDQWNWSRSNLFFGLPFYHTGARATYNLSSRWSATLAGYNGWNSVTDNNEEKSVALQVIYNVPDHVNLGVVYFGGIERPQGAPEGRAWRHLLDAYVGWNPTPALSLSLHADAGFEPNNRGTSSWAAGAAYFRLQTTRWLYLAARGDLFYESAPQGATPLFWLLTASNHGWVSSGTVTFDVRPHDNVSIRLEYRHDQSEAPMFFSLTPATDPHNVALPTATAQDTVTLGMTTWF